jgi:hypothetical protein
MYTVLHSRSTVLVLTSTYRDHARKPAFTGGTSGPGEGRIYIGNGLRVPSEFKSFGFTK